MIIWKTQQWNIILGQQISLSLNIITNEQERSMWE